MRPQKLYVASVRGTWGNDPEKPYFSDPKLSKQEAYMDLATHCHNNAISADFTQVAMGTYEITDAVVINPQHEFPELFNIVSQGLAG